MTDISTTVVKQELENVIPFLNKMDIVLITRGDLELILGQSVKPFEGDELPAVSLTAIDDVDEMLDMEEALKNDDDKPKIIH